MHSHFYTYLYIYTIHIYVNMCSVNYKAEKLFKGPVKLEHVAN